MRELVVIKLPGIEYYGSTVKKATNTAWEVREVFRQKMIPEYNQEQELSKQRRGKHMIQRTTCIKERRVKEFI